MVLERLPEWVEAYRRRTVAIAAGLTLLIAAIDWRVAASISLGSLYVLPIVLASTVLSRAGIAALALACAFLREFFSPFPWQAGFGFRLLVTFVSFCLVGLLISEVTRSRRLMIERFRQQQVQSQFEQEADRILRTLVEASPLSIAITDASGTIILANRAYGQFFGIKPEDAGENIFCRFPALKPILRDAGAPGSPPRLELESAGTKPSGEVFWARIWITVYVAGIHRLPGSAAGPRLAWVLWDASDDVRGRDLSQNESMVIVSRVSLAAFSHEIRNISAAAGAMARRLASRLLLNDDPDFRALTGALQSCSELAAEGLRFDARTGSAVVDLGATMFEARLTLESLAEEAGVRLLLTIPPGLPVVRCRHPILMQVFLNLLANSVRATRQSVDPQVTIEAASEADSAIVRFCDNGLGVPQPEQLFHAFASTTGGAGMGLFLSRALLRSFGGDVYYEPAPRGACFAVRLLRAPEIENADTGLTD